jgi:hypothetical protein
MYIARFQTGFNSFPQRSESTSLIMKDKKLDLNALMHSYNFDEYPEPSYLNVKVSGFSFWNFLGVTLLGAAIFGITHSYFHLSRNHHHGNGLDSSQNVMQSFDVNAACNRGQTLILRDCNSSFLTDLSK